MSTKVLIFVLNNRFTHALLLLLLIMLSFHKTLSFWFFHGWEASWLWGLTGGDFSFVNLMRSHGFVSYINYLFFGWNPKGWYATGIFLHWLVSLAVYFFVGKMTKNKLIALGSSILFATTTAHHDVVTWGSFESLYAAQTVGFYLALFLFWTYRQTKRKINYVAAILFFIFSAVLRESGLIFLPLVFILDGLLCQWSSVQKLFSKHKITVSSFLWFVPHIVFWTVGIVYLYVRTSYGGSAHDFIDDRVQFRALLLKEWRIAEYIWYGILGFGYFIGPYIVPYPILNALRELIVSFISIHALRTYFFSFFGLILYGTFWFLLARQRKSRYYPYLLFCLSAFSIVTLFYSFAWTTKPSHLETLYSWSENRWRYLGFTLLSPFLVLTGVQIFHSHKKRPAIQKVILLLSGLFVAGNIFLLQKIQLDMYIKNSYPAVRFYETFHKTFPNLTQNDKFYYFKSSPGLNDFFAELFYIRRQFYPALLTLPKDWVRSQMFFLLKYLSEGTQQVNNIHFVDYSIQKGVEDRTQEVSSMLKNSTPTHVYSSELINKNGKVTAKLQHVPPVEFPHRIEIQGSSTLRHKKTEESVFTVDQAKSIFAFSSSLARLSQEAIISVCETMRDADDEPFDYLKKEQMVDGNIGKRSYWWADCRPAWVSYDLGQVRDIVGFTWGSYAAADSIPRTYEYQISQDGITWETVYGRERNEKDYGLDKLPQPVAARFVRFFIEETRGRGIVQLSEFTPVFADAQAILDIFTTHRELFAAVYSFWERLSSEAYSELARNSQPIVWIPISWETKPANGVPLEDRTRYIPIIADGTERTYSVQLAESEAYSSHGQFLKRFMTNLILVESPAATFGISRVSYIPLFTLYNAQ